MIDLTPLLVDVIVIVTAFVAVKLVPEVKKVVESFRASYPAESWFLDELIATGIDGAEKQFSSGQGAEKLEAVLVFVEKQAEHYGVHYDEYVVSVKIHAKLRELETAVQNSVK